MPNSPALEGLFVRLDFDRHMIARLAIDRHSRGYDVLTTEEAGLDTATDEQQLAFATSEGRAILTFNIRDFAPFHEQWLAARRTHAGIIVSRQLGNQGCRANVVNFTTGLGDVLWRAAPFPGAYAGSRRPAPLL
jgi:hypothetical protein